QEPAAPASKVQSETADQTAWKNSSVPLGNLPKKFTVDDLAGFLIHPLQTRPAGRMPSMYLTDGEATAIAMYLLRAQTASTNSSRQAVRIKGLDYEYFEGEFTQTTELDRVKPSAIGTV